MKSEYIWLCVTGVVGVLWLFVVKRWLLADILPLATVPNPPEWVEQVYTWSAIASLLLGFGLALIWIYRSSKARFASSRAARARTGAWWLWAILLYIVLFGLYLGIELGIGYPYTQPGSGEVVTAGVVETVFANAPLGWMALFLVIDGALLFWLPTALSSLGTLRYITPGARGLRKLTGG